MKLLIVEDEEFLAESIQTLLQENGYQADVVTDGQMGVQYAGFGIYDLIIMDVMMPQLNGYDAVRAIRAKRIGTPILFLTARSALEDRITGLHAGADYYLTKPFDVRELLACVNTLLRRQGNQVNALMVGNTTLDLDVAELRCGVDHVRLSAKEFEIAQCLFRAGQRNLSKEMILEKVWGFESEAGDNYVEVYMGFLRRKLSSIHSDVQIKTVRRLGYHLEVTTS